MYLLDTHILLWWLAGGSSLSAEVVKVIENPKHVIWVSSVTVWEVVIKQSLGKLKVPANLLETIFKNGFKELSVSFKHAEKVRELPLHHSDPFDRLLIAQAIVEDLTFITKDQVIPSYSLKIVRA